MNRIHDSHEQKHQRGSETQQSMIIHFTGDAIPDKGYTNGGDF